MYCIGYCRVFILQPASTRLSPHQLIFLTLRSELRPKYSLKKALSFNTTFDSLRLARRVSKVLLGGWPKKQKAVPTKATHHSNFLRHANLSNSHKNRMQNQQMH